MTLPSRFVCLLALFVLGFLPSLAFAQAGAVTHQQITDLQKDIKNTIEKAQKETGQKKEELAARLEEEYGQLRDMLTVALNDKVKAKSSSAYASDPDYKAFVDERIQDYTDARKAALTSLRKLDATINAAPASASGEKPADPAQLNQNIQDAQKDVTKTEGEIKTSLELKKTDPAAFNKQVDTTKGQYSTLRDQLDKLIEAYKKLAAADSGAKLLADEQISKRTTERNEIDTKLVELSKPSEKSLTVDPNARVTPFTRAVVGFDISATAAQNPQSKFLADFFTTAPLFGKMTRKGCPSTEEQAVLKAALKDTQEKKNVALSNASLKFFGGVKNLTEDQLEDRLVQCDARSDDPFLVPVWGWFNPRISSVSKQTTIPVTSLATPFTALGLANANVDQLVQSLDFLGGMDITLRRVGNSFQGPLTTETARTGVYLTTSFGMSTPLVNDQRTPAVFQLNETLRDRYGITDATKTKIAFITRDRSRFYWQYYAGLRVKTYYFKADDPQKPEEQRLEDKFPGQFDVLIGQNEAITGAGLNGPVLRLEGFYPFPFANSVHLFGTVMMRLKGRGNEPGVVLGDPVPSPDVFAADVERVQIDPLQRRDYFRIGIGFDLLQLLKHTGNGSTNNNSQPPNQ